MTNSEFSKSFDVRLYPIKGVCAKCLRLCYAILMLNEAESINDSAASDMIIRYPGYPHTIPLT